MNGKDGQLHPMEWREEDKDLDPLQKFAVRILGKLDKFERRFDAHDTHLLEQDGKLDEISKLHWQLHGRLLKAEEITKPIGWVKDFVLKHFWKVIPIAFIVFYVIVYMCMKIGDYYVTQFLHKFQF